VPQAAFSGLPVTLSLAGASTDHPYSLGIPQTRVEEVLEARALDLGADIRRGHELRVLEQDSACVTATIADTATGREYRARAAYLAPNLALITDSGDTDLATQLTLASGRPLLLDLAEEASAIGDSAAAWADRVSLVRARCRAHPDLRALLLRPDGHTAWLSAAADHRRPTDGLRQALAHWHGPRS
jgi:hypothetical protein